MPRRIVIIKVIPTFVQPSIMLGSALVGLVTVNIVMEWEVEFSRGTLRGGNK